MFIKIDTIKSTGYFNRNIIFIGIVLITYLLLLKLSTSVVNNMIWIVQYYVTNFFLLSATLFVIHKQGISFSLTRGVKKSIPYSLLSAVLIIIIFFLIIDSIPPLFSIDIPLLLQSISICILAPIAEEIFFRGFLLNFINDHFGKIFSVIMVSILFGGLHFYQGAAIQMAVLSIILCISVFLTRSLLWPIILHIAWNTSATIRTEPNNLSILIITVFSITLIIILAIRGLLTDKKRVNCSKE